MSKNLKFILDRRKDISSPIDESFSKGFFNLNNFNNNIISLSDELSLSFYEDNLYNKRIGENSELVDYQDNKRKTEEFNVNFINNFSFKKNRNYLINNLNSSIDNEKNSQFSKEIRINKNEFNEINKDSSNSKYMRCDSLLIKFKSSLGKWLIKIINQKLKRLKEKNLLKRRIKIYAFNYKKFTLIVSYKKNKEWLNYKIKDLLLLGDEENQIKNRKSLKTLYNKKLNELKEIKDFLELKYQDIIEKFYYLSEDFNNFKNNIRIKELDDNFKKIMKISLFEKNGFIKFLLSRKGNIKKS